MQDDFSSPHPVSRRTGSPCRGAASVVARGAKSGFVGNGYDSANLAASPSRTRHPVTGEHLITRLRPDFPVNGRQILGANG